MKWRPVWVSAFQAFGDGRKLANCRSPCVFRQGRQSGGSRMLKPLSRSKQRGAIMPKPIKRKSPAWRQGEKKGEDYVKENLTPIHSFQQGNYCQNCRYFSDSWGTMTVITLCRITGFRVKGSDRACELFTPCAEYSRKSCLTPEAIDGMVKFLNRARLCRSLGFPQESLKLTAFFIFRQIPRLFRRWAYWRNVLDTARAKQPCTGWGAFRLFSCPKTAN